MLQELDDREKFLEALLEKYEQQQSAAQQQQLRQQQQGAGGATPAAGAAPAPSQLLGGRPPLAPEEARAVLLCNERGRQARERARIALTIKKQRRLEDKRSTLGRLPY